MRQPVLVDLVMAANFSQAADSDKLLHTVDYEKVVKTAQELAKKKHFQLLEHFAAELGKTVMAEFARIDSCNVRVTKPKALKNAIPIFEISFRR